MRGRRDHPDLSARSKPGASARPLIRRAPPDTFSRKGRRERLSRPPLHQVAVEVRAPVAEEAPGGAVGGEEIEVEAGGDDALVVAAQLGDQIAAMVGDERRAIEALAAAGIAVP